MLKSCESAIIYTGKPIIQTLHFKDDVGASMDTRAYTDIEVYAVCGSHKSKFDVQPIDAAHGLYGIVLETSLKNANGTYTAIIPAGAYRIQAYYMDESGAQRDTVIRTIEIEQGLRDV